MQNIYQEIKNMIFYQQHDYLDIYNRHRDLIEAFLDQPSLDNAKALFQFIANIHGKNYVLSIMEDLRLYEDGFNEILPKHREHFLHSASVYVLGLALYNSCNILREALTTSRHTKDDVYSQKSSFLFRWSLAAFLHDSTYPLEMCIKAFNDYSSYLHGGNDRKDLIINKHLIDHFNSVPIILRDEEIYYIKKKTSLGLIANYLTCNKIITPRQRVTYTTINKFLNKEVEGGLKDGVFDHGIFSSLFILKRIHELYETNVNWPVRDFYYEVVDSATAIFLHNFYKYSDLKDLLGCSKYEHVYPNPLGYLLCLCDTLCEWNRKDTRDESEFSIMVTDNEIVFKTPEELRSKLMNQVDFLNGTIHINII